MNVPEPKATYIEDEYIFLWDELGIEVVAERFREKDGNIYASVTPRSPSGDGFLPPENVNLGSTRSIKMFANNIGDRGLLSGTEWFDALTHVARLATKRYREGEPSVVLADVEWRGVEKYVVWPYIDQHGTTILFGDGAVSKSIHALGFGVSVATGTPVIPNTDVRVKGPVLYLDWEADAETHAERLYAVCAGAGIEMPTNIHYMRRVGSIAASVREIRREIASRGVVLVIVDSVGAACGGDPEQAASIIAAMNAIRAFGVPTLAIHHIAKEAKDKSKPFGSVYSPNLARRTWRLDKDQAAGESSIYVRALNFKANNGKLQESLSHGVTFDVDGNETLNEVSFNQAALGRVPTSGRGLKNPIARELRGGPMTVHDIALAMEAREDTVRQTLRRHPDWFTKVGDRWALVETNQDNVTNGKVSRDVVYTGNERDRQSRPPIGGRMSQPVPSDEWGEGEETGWEPEPW